MNLTKAETPDVSDGNANAQTGRNLSDWFAHLDAAGGLARGRRDLAMYLISQQKLDEWWATTVVVEYERARGAVEKDGRPKG